MKKALLISSSEKLPHEVVEYQQRGLVRSWDFVFLTETFGFKDISASNHSTYFTPDFSDGRAVVEILREIKARHQFDQVVAMDEFAVYVAGLAREIFGLEGPTSVDARFFRDKIAMKEVAQAADLAVPATFNLSELAHVKEGLPYPLILKPRSLAGAVGVLILRNSRDLELALSQPALSPKNEYVDMCPHQFLVEELIEGSLFHLDGLVHEGKILFFSAAAYIGSPLDFLSGKPLGSVTLEGQAEVSVWRNYAQDVIAAFNVPNGAFHLEAFCTPQGKRVFLELAARPGGGPIVEALCLKNGVDLRLGHLLLNLGEIPRFDQKQNADPSVGFIFFPKVIHAKNKLCVQTALVLASKIQTLVISRLPKAGTTASGEFFDHNDNLGTFIFQGSERAIRRDIQQTIQSYRLELVERPIEVS